ncbi:MAG TPA: T9SS type A sorting domain-containing protein, partial [Puia sp.]|nr:T9SS type A sorting domain-containing protein [Puia sp.]
FAISIRNNAPGGGGNDWAIDDISLNTCLVILPVTLVGFEGSQQPGGVALSWQTASEQNTSYFDVQRRDGNNNYISIGHVTASTLASGSTYHFTDNTALLQDETNYRLGIVDIDGKVTYSRVISVKEEGMVSKAINIAPNPAKGSTTLYLVADAPGTVLISLSNLAGSRVYSQTNSVSKGQNALPIQSIDRLAKGIYIVRMVSGNQTACTKLLVE